VNSTCLWQYQADVAWSNYSVANAFEVSGKSAEAEESCRNALTIFQKIVARFPEAADNQNELAATMVALARVLRQRHELVQARRLLEEALPHHQAALGANPQNPDYGTCYRENRRLLADILVRLDNPAAAAQIYIAAFAADVKSGEEWKGADRYLAARAAVLAGCGKGSAASRLGPEDRASLRRHALDWLNADLKVRARQIASGKPQQRVEGSEALRRWRQDPDSAGVRGDALATLPEVECATWRRLWAEVDALLARGSGPTSPLALPGPKAKVP
jgi:tetratricopeptide (TPR) repeat protein